MELDTDAVSPQRALVLEELIADPEFEPKKLRRSVACESICTWVRALVQYCKAMRSVEPKRARLAEARAALQGARDRAQAAQAAQARAHEELAALESRLAAVQAVASARSEELQECEVVLYRGEQLLRTLNQGCKLKAVC